jgi:serine/threonine protein kinase
MTGEEQLRRIARAIADGIAVNWEDELAHAPPGQRLMIESLQELAQIGRPEAFSNSSVADECDSTIEPLESWGPFVLHELVGRGSYGTVYRARDSKLDREVALKLRIAGPASGEFLHEGRLLARLRHPNIVCVYGAETHAGRDGMWMELIRGRTYHRIVESDGPLSAGEAALVGIDVCSALAAVHAAGLVHRDVTAKNVMREVGGRVVLLDFSAGRNRALKDEGQEITGTPMYLAPELLTGQHSAAIPSDVYSVGVLLFFLVSGRYPFEARTLAELRAAHSVRRQRGLSEARVDLPEGFAAVVEKALLSAPAERPSVAEMSKVLGVGRQTVTVVTSEASAATSRPQRVRPWSRPVPAWLTMLLILLAVMGSAAVVSIWRPFAPISAGAPPPPTSRPTNEQWAVLSGYLELADQSGESADWEQAIALYESAEELLWSIAGLDDPLRSVVLAQKAWAMTVAGRPAAAHEWFDLALYKLAQEVGHVHPMRTAIEMARAEAFVREKRLTDAASALGRAVTNHRRMLATLGIVTPTNTLTAVPVPDISTSACSDADGDWVLDVFERALGLNPNAVDSDGDGASDDEEDSDSDGTVNGIAWPHDCDPRRVLGHYGNIDPLRLGFRQERQFSGRIAPKDGSSDDAWRVEADPMGFYFVKLTKAQKRAALARGWRLRARMALWEGNGFVNLDLFPQSSRFDLNMFVRPPNTASLLLMASSMPRLGDWIDQGHPGRLPLVEFVADPISDSVALLINGRTVRKGYRGYRQYQEDFGLFFGATDDVGAAARGSADFSLAWLTIR